MKKRIAILLSMAMAASFTFTGTAVYAETEAAAEETATEAEATEAEAPVELKWEDGEKFLEQTGLKGDFVTFDEIAIKMWMPEDLLETELTDEDKEDGYIGYYMSEDEKKVVSVMYVNVDGMDLDAYGEYLAGEDDVTEIQMGIVNELPCISYTLAESDAACIAFTTEAGYILEVTMTPVSDEDFSNAAAIITSSIQPEAAEAETAETEVAEEEAAEEETAE